MEPQRVPRSKGGLTELHGRQRRAKSWKEETIGTGKKKKKKIITQTKWTKVSPGNGEHAGGQAGISGWGDRATAREGKSSQGRSQLGDVSEKGSKGSERDQGTKSKLLTCRCS